MAGGGGGEQSCGRLVRSVGVFKELHGILAFHQRDRYGGDGESRWWCVVLMLLLCVGVCVAVVVSVWGEGKMFCISRHTVIPIKLDQHGLTGV